MTIFDSIKYPVSDDYTDTWEPIPNEMFNEWVKVMTENHIFTFSGNEQNAITLMRKVILEWEDPL